MMLVKNPSPCSLSRFNPDCKTTMAEERRSSDDSRHREGKIESPKWEPLRKFAPGPSKSTAEAAQKNDESETDRDSTARKHSPDANEQSRRLTQRMRDLYDFKTENEWPKRAVNVRRGNAWISKSSSEEDRTNHQGRRNSQDLEFNDRVNVIKLKDTKVQSAVHRETKESTKKVERPSGTDTFNSEYEERLRKFNERLRFSEDLGLAKPKIKERRTYSDDYDEKSRRASTKSAKTDGSARSTRADDKKETATPRSSIKLSRADGSIRSTRSEDSKTETRHDPVEQKRLSDASRDSRGSYAEVNPISPVKRDSRTSDASYASIAANHPAKRASVDCKSTRQMVELPPRRAFSQTEERSSTPVPPVQWKDDPYAVARLKQISEHQKRDSTRYKVYLT